MKIVTVVSKQSLGRMDFGVTAEYSATIHQIRKWLPCNFENCLQLTKEMNTRKELTKMSPCA